MKMLKVMRTIETETAELEIGDKIKFNLANDEEYTATAVRREEDGAMLFVFDCSMNREYIMDREWEHADAGYEKSNMREYLRDSVAKLIPEHIMDHMVRFDNGDYLRLMTREEVFGAKDGSGQIPYFKDRRNRAALRDGHFGEWWLQDRDVEDDTAAFFSVVSVSGSKGCSIANANYGVRPAFKIGDL